MKKTDYVGESLENIWLSTSVGETDSDSGVAWKKKTSYLGEPLSRFLFVASVGETD